MRGELGAGTNRLNVYTVRKATKGLASFIEKLGEEAKNEVLLQPMILVINHLSLQWKSLLHLVHVVSQHMCLKAYVQRQYFLSQFVIYIQ